MRIIVTTTRLDPAGLAVLNDRNADLRFIDHYATPEELEVLTGEFDPHGILSRGLDITPRAMELAPSLRVIAKTGSGLDNLDIEDATRRRILVLKNFGANSPSVAEHALGLMFALARHTVHHDAHMRAGEWSRFYFKAHELRGKHLGLVGFGPSAQILASLVRALDMPVSVYSPRYRGSDAHPGVQACSSLDELLPRVDILSLHCPLTPETRKMINASSIGQMRAGAWIINTARGGLIDEAALIDALRSGQLGAAALDVYEAEPMPQTHPLFAMKNVVLTPHVAGASIQSWARAHAQAAQNLLAALDGKDIDARMVVNPKVLADG